MIRKSLFLGLTLVLVVALVSLIIRGRQLEKQQAALPRPTELVQQSHPTPTRVLAPRDLEIVNSTTQSDSGRTALNEIKIRNNGSVPYSRIQLRIVYLDRSGKELAANTRSIERTVMPGASIGLPGITDGDAPAETAKFRVSILSADIGTPR